jgi:hypothetical protein
LEGRSAKKGWKDEEVTDVSSVGNDTIWKVKTTLNANAELPVIVFYYEHEYILYIVKGNKYNRVEHEIKRCCIHQKNLSSFKMEDTVPLRSDCCAASMCVKLPTTVFLK